jgi:single-strand DNA-binding protein
MNLNQVQLGGNITRDPELKYTPKGTAVAEFGLAVNRKYKSDSGEAREEVTFLDVTAWGGTAEAIVKYHKKGDPIYIAGRLQLDTWEDKETNKKRSKIKVIAETFQFIKPFDGASKRGSQGPDDQNERPQQRGAPPRQKQPEHDPDLDVPEEDFIPS